MAQTTFFSYRDVTNIIVLTIVETKNGKNQSGAMAEIPNSQAYYKCK